MEINGDTIRAGDVYKYRCVNDQGYGYMISVKTSKGWDFIDTYQISSHGCKTARPKMRHPSGKSLSWVTASMTGT